MFTAMEILYPLIAGHELTLRTLLIGIPLWLLGGPGWGYTMKIVMNRSERKDKYRP
jgi:hypothetical protein